MRQDLSELCFFSAVAQTINNTEKAEKGHISSNGKKTETVVPQTPYEAINAIRCNDAGLRRRERVRKWYNDLAATKNINLEKEKRHLIELLKSL